MRIEFVEVSNFRKLRSTRVGLSKDKTVFVGANNSGKTSAMVAMRYFLVERERKNFALTDFTLCHWPSINAIGAEWEKPESASEPPNAAQWDVLLPALDVWLDVDFNEIQYVRKILPTLEWAGGRLGVRLRLEPKDINDLRQDYLLARTAALEILAAGTENDPPAKAEPYDDLAIWPSSLTEFLQRRLGRYFHVSAYVLDPAKCKDTVHGSAQPQPLDPSATALDGDPFRGLIRIDEISAQRGFGEDASPGDADDDASGAKPTAGTQKLSEQLRRYYNRHLDPYEKPTTKDLDALKAIDHAQKAFDGRLKDGFEAPIKEVERLGYPGVANPRLSIATRLRPVEGLNHESAVQYAVRMVEGATSIDLLLPETSNGLGYQNLISMVFRLMSFRDAWMRVGKAMSKAAASAETFIPPLHLVLIEEPEAHLHTQVQQVFIRQAYAILRAHDKLKGKADLTTQMVVSTHSSHVAHECEFASLRYFRRMPAKDGEIPTSCVVNLSHVFGEETDTKRFVTRYLKVTHCDLFFADAAVLIEGPAERVLAPHFVRNHEEFSSLAECYITWLEIGGSHAHRLRELIEALGLTTLVITDLDAMNAAAKAVLPKRGSGQKSRNKTLASWCPATDDLDSLLNQSSASKIKTYTDERFAVRAAYQFPLKVTFKGNSIEAIPNTLEDALVFQNMDLFASHQGTGLFAKFRKAIAESATLEDLRQAIFDALKDGGKAEFALDLLEIEDAAALKPPEYIREGFIWLAEQLRVRQQELGLVTAEVAVPALSEQQAA